MRATQALFVVLRHVVRADNIFQGVQLPVG